MRCMKGEEAGDHALKPKPQGVLQLVQGELSGVCTIQVITSQLPRLSVMPTAILSNVSGKLSFKQWLNPTPTYKRLSVMAEFGLVHARQRCNYFTRRLPLARSTGSPQGAIKPRLQEHNHVPQE